MGQRVLRVALLAALVLTPLACLNVIGLDGYSVGTSGSGGSTSGGTGGSAGTDGSAAAGTGGGPADAGACADGGCLLSCTTGLKCPSGMFCSNDGKCVPDPQCSVASGTCTLYPQCGCTNAQTCVAKSNTTGKCAAAGTGLFGAPCQDTSDCAKGLTCYGDLCVSFCKAKNDCLLQQGTFECTPAGTSQSTEDVCVATCAPSGGAGCGPGAKCATSYVDPKPPDFICVRAGTAKAGSDCSNDTYSCAPGLTCDDNKCKVLCPLTAAACDGGTCGLGCGDAGACTTATAGGVPKNAATAWGVCPLP
jgi:hypothetical protein